MRRPKPWFRKQTDSWYVEIHGKQVPLAKGKANREAAFDAFYKLMADHERPSEDVLTVAELCDRFLRWSELHHHAETFEWHKGFLQRFCRKFGRHKVGDIVPYNVTTWLDENPKWQGARRHAAYVVKRAFSWGHKEGLLSKNPLTAIKIGRGGRRERILSKVERDLTQVTLLRRSNKDLRAIWGASLHYICMSSSKRRS